MSRRADPVRCRCLQLRSLSSLVAVALAVGCRKEVKDNLRGLAYLREDAIALASWRGRAPELFPHLVESAREAFPDARVHADADALRVGMWIASEPDGSPVRAVFLLRERRDAEGTVACDLAALPLRRSEEVPPHARSYPPWTALLERLERRLADAGIHSAPVPAEGPGRLPWEGR